VHTRLGRYYRQHDWPEADAPTAGRFRRGFGVCSDLNHVVYRGCELSARLATTCRRSISKAATGLLAVIVLLVIMNWFFHKI